MGSPMFKLPIRTWICTAAAVLFGQHGAVSRQAHPGSMQSRDGRRTCPESRAATRGPTRRGRDAGRVGAENHRLRQALADLKRGAEQRVRFDKVKQRELATRVFSLFQDTQLGEVFADP